MSLAMGSRRHCRSGTVLILVLLCLTVAGMLLVPVARRSGVVRRSQQADQCGLQAQWLAEAGVERAASRLAADRGYRGETWRIPATELHGLHEAEVRITVRAADGRSGRSSIQVQADYPRDALLRCRRVQQIDVDREQRTPPRAATSSRQNNPSFGETS